jgi:large subunit GTPase 1
LHGCLLSLLLCCCAGLVFPRFATSKAEMVAAGVIPIDRLTDIRAPIDVVADRCGQPQLEAVYGLQLGPRTLDAASAATADDSAAAAGASGTSSSSSAGGSNVPAAQQGAGHSSAAADQVFLSMGTRLLRSLARARGWAAGAGLPDEVRAGRQILRDYTNGKLLYCKLPPGSRHIGFAPVVAPLPGTVNGMQLEQQQQVGVSLTPQAQQHQHQQAVGAGLQQQAGASGSSSDIESEGSDAEADVAAGLPASVSAVSPSPAGAFDASALLLSEADLELMEGLGIGQKAKAKRPEHKFHKKAARTKGTRGLQADAGGYDGAALSTGKKGGLVRVGGY